MGTFEEAWLAETAGDLARAAALYNEAAEEADPRAPAMIGRLFSRGEVVVRDYDLARQAFEDGMSLRDPRAFTMMGIAYAEGEGVPQSHSKAKNLYEQAIQMGDSWAYYMLGRMYHYGRGVGEDYSRALEYYEEASARGDSCGFIGIGALHEEGKGFRKDLAKALELYLRATGEGDRSAYRLAPRHVGRMHALGVYGSPNYMEAAKWYRKAAAAGDNWSIDELGRFHECGRLSSAPNYIEAAYYYGIGHSRGYDWSTKGLVRMILYHGVHVEGIDNPVGLIEERLSDSPDVLRPFLGWLYYEGKGVPANRDRAINIWRAGAEGGNAECTRNVGHALRDRKDYRGALEWYRRAAALGDNDAMFQIAQAYASGEGVRKDEAVCKEWIKKAAEAGHVGAKGMVDRGLWNYSL